jgi:hypothetical protein
MEVVVPWQVLIDLIQPRYPETSRKTSRPPYPLSTMLRIHLLKRWHSLSDLAMEETLIEVPTMRRSSGVGPAGVAAVHRPEVLHPAQRQRRCREGLRDLPF